MPDNDSRMDADELIAAMSDQIDAMTGEDFDPTALDAYLDALDAQSGGASEWDAAQAERRFREKHTDLFLEEVPVLEVLPGKKRGHPHGLRLAGRIAAIAAVAAVGPKLVGQAMGIDVFGMFGKWGREEFWFPGTEQGSGMPEAPMVREGEYDSLQAALRENGVLTPMAPTWVPEAGERFGELTGTFEVTREAQSALFTGDYRDADGRGYTVEVQFHVSGGFLAPRAFAQEGAEEYVCDGTPYYIGKGNGGVTRIDWCREQVTGSIEGDLDRETARRLVESITRPGGEREYAAPDRSRKPAGNDLQSMLEVYRLPPELSPAWFPEGFEKTELYEATAHFDQDVTMIHFSFDREEEQREYAVQLTWWEDPAVPVPPVFAGDWTQEQVYEHNGTQFEMLTDGNARLVTWQDGHVYGWIWGDLSSEEAIRMVDSIPDWPDEKPEREEPEIVVNERDRKEYDSPAAALEDRGLDPALAPAWIPEGYETGEVWGEKFPFGVSVHAAWFKGEELLSFHVDWQDEGVSSAGTTIYSKDDDPVEEYVHNGVTYYIMTNGEYRTTAWKDGALEGSFSGPITLEEAKQIVDSISYTAEEE